MNFTNWPYIRKYLIEYDVISRIFQLLNAGYINELKEKWWNQRNTECKVDDNVPHEISIEKIGGLFILLMIGTCASLIMLMFEYLWFKYHKEPEAIVFGVTRTSHVTVVRVNGMLNKNL